MTETETPRLAATDAEPVAWKFWRKGLGTEVADLDWHPSVFITKRKELIAALDCEVWDVRPLASIPAGALPDG